MPGQTFTIIMGKDDKTIKLQCASTAKINNQTWSASGLAIGAASPLVTVTTTAQTSWLSAPSRAAIIKAFQTA